MKKLATWTAVFGIATVAALLPSDDDKKDSAEASHEEAFFKIASGQNSVATTPYDPCFITGSAANHTSYTFKAGMLTSAMPHTPSTLDKLPDEAEISCLIAQSGIKGLDAIKTKHLAEEIIKIAENELLEIQKENNELKTSLIIGNARHEIYVLMDDMAPHYPQYQYLESSFQTTPG